MFILKYMNKRFKILNSESDYQNFIEMDFKIDKPKIRSNIRKYKYLIIIVTFSVLIITWGIHYLIWAKDGSDYHRSFSASLAEDIYFFIVLGIVIFIIQLALQTRPEDNVFVSRVNSTANNKQVSREAKEFLIKNIRKTLAYANDSELKITIEEIDKNRRLLEILSENSSNIVNMCSDEDFDVKSGYKVVPDKEHKGNYGYISYASIKENNPNSKLKEDLVAGNIQILDKCKTYEKEAKNFRIPSDSSATFTLNFIYYNNLNLDKDLPESWNYMRVRKFNRALKVTMVNNCDFNVIAHFLVKRADQKNLDFKTLIEQSEKKVLNKKSENNVTDIITNLELEPEDSFLYYFCTN